jgi:hypothetical protein
MPTRSGSGSGRGTGASPANLTKNLKGIDFPADKQDLLKHAQHLHAEKVVIDEIQRMDERQYSSMADVMKSFEPGEGKSSSKSRSSSSSSSDSSSGSRSHSSGSEGKSSSSHGSSSHGGKSSHR